MYKKIANYFSHLKFVPFYLQTYGLIKTIKTIHYYNYRLFRLSKLDKTKESIIEVNGYNLSVIPNDPGISSELRIFKVHEPLTTKMTIQELKKGMVCLDIGSNIGYYALLESKAVKDTGNIIAIEPSPTNFEYLKKNIELGKVTNLDLYNFAAGDKDGEINFLIHDRSNLGYVITEGKPIPKSAKTIRIPIKRIDPFLEEKKIEKLDFVRMDVEGFEIKLFEGLWQTLRKFKPMIQMEFHNSQFKLYEKKKFFEKLKTEGYEIKYFIPRDLDRPIVGNLKDIKNFKITNLLEMFDNRIMPETFMVFLENNVH